MKIFVLPALVAISTSTIAQPLPSGMIMNRLQAGELDKSGWTYAKSTNGNFSVQMPCKYNDFTMKDGDPPSVTLKTENLGCTMQNGAQFIVTRIVYRRGQPVAESLFSGARKNGFIHGATNKTRIFKGYQSIDSEINDGRFYAWEKMIQLKSDNMLIGMQVPVGASAGYKKLAERFFDSLEVER
jgi:hypothetical protein